MGILIPQHVRGKEIFSFEYNETWLTSSGQALFLDPNLSMYKGKKYLPEAKMQQFSSKQHTFLTKRFDRIQQQRIHYILVSNTGDHLRNHVFILINQGWRLAPAYDMNPNELGNGQLWHYFTPFPNSPGPNNLA